MKRWTKQEMEYLDFHWGSMSIPAIAKKLGRSVVAVQGKAYRMGYTCHIHSGQLITLNMLADAINKKCQTISTTWVKRGLPVKYRKSINRQYRMIDIDEFWAWAEHHKSLIDFSKIEENILGKEPEWVKEARHVSFVSRRNTQKWTSADDTKLKFMLSQYKYTYADIAEELNRTEGAVKRRIFDLKIKQRPLRNEVRKWTDKEKQVVLSMLNSGYSFEQIANTLDRTALAVRGMYERLSKNTKGAHYE